MATILLRNIKGSPLTNTEVDNNFQYLLNAIGANGSTIVPTPTGTINGSTSVPVLSVAPTITSATLITPALGTPASGVLTNCTGTASGLTAGNVVTNANLTGAITSVGNATSLGSFTSLQLLTALVDESGTGLAVFNTSPTLVTPNLGTPSAGVLTNCTGTASGLTAGAVTNGVYTAGDQTIAGNKTFSSTILGNISGNSATVTNGVYNNLTYANPTWITSLAGSKITGYVDNATSATNATTVTNGFYLTGNQTVVGNTTFTGTLGVSSTLTGSGIINGTTMQYGGIAMPRMVQVYGNANATYNIPSWVKRITVSYLTLVPSATGMILFRINNSTTGYTTTVSQFISGSPDSYSVAGFNNTAVGFPFVNTTSANVSMYGVLTLTQIGTSWVFNATTDYGQTAPGWMSHSIGAWGGTLTSITFVTSTSAFVNGNVSIIYEG